ATFWSPPRGSASPRRSNGRWCAQAGVDAEMNSDTASPLPPRKVIRRERPLLASVPGDLRSLASYRNLFSVMTATRLKIRYRQSVLGWLWAVLQPLALMVLYSAIFSHAIG